jgi:ATP-dependent RNA helicase DeaD
VTFFTNNPSLSRALSEHSYTEATPVQTAVIAPGAAGRDLLVSAQTGSGKTIAYGLAIAQTVLGSEPAFASAGAPQALVVAPTRELALQVERELAWLFAWCDARIVACVGGMDAQRERRALGAGAHIVVGTPGRLRDHIERGGLNLQRLQAIVLDEADEMLDLGFREDLEFILDATPAARRSLLFSATMPKAIATLARRYQRDALRIEVEGGRRGHVDIDYRAIRIAYGESEHAVVNLLRQFEAPTALVFCNTREAVRHLHAILQERGFSAVLLSGELSQHERNQAMQALRNGRARVGVATDVAARGIDLPGVAIVIHADLPHDVETLQHRSGRTGRAGRKGVSALLVPQSKRRRAEQLFHAANIQPQWSGPPSADEVRALDRQRLLDGPLLSEEPSEDDLAAAHLLLASASAEKIAAALARVWRGGLPGLEEVRDPGEPFAAREPRARREPGEEPRRESMAHDKPRGGGKHAFDRSSGGVWFKLDIGRAKNADPKWLLPMICRAGDLTKSDIGAIRIFEHETKFEVAASAAEKFARDIRQRPSENIRITLADAAAEAANPYIKPSRKPNSPRPGKAERARK